MAHQTINVNLETRLRARLGWRLDKILPVHIRLKDIPFAIGPARSPKLSEPARDPNRSSSHLSRRLVAPKRCAEALRRRERFAQAGAFCAGGSVLRRREHMRERMIHRPGIFNAFRTCHATVHPHQTIFVNLKTIFVLG